MSKTKSFSLLFGICFLLVSNICTAQESSEIVLPGAPNEKPLVDNLGPNDENTGDMQGLEVSGELGFAWNFWQAPSSQSNQTAFALPLLKLNADTDVSDKGHVHVEIHHGTRDANSGKPDTQLKQAYLDTAFLKFEIFKLGLVPSPWGDISSEQSDLSYLGSDFLPMPLRYGYLNPEDLGFYGIAQIGQSNWNFGFSYVNGEGNRQEEVGPGKDLLIFIDYMAAKKSAAGQFFMSLFASQGHYDGVEPTMSTKRRSGLMLGFNRGPGLGFLLEGMKTEDPVDSINLKVVDGVDLTSWGGKMATGLIQSGQIIYRAEDAFEYFVRADSVVPIEKVKDNFLKSQIIGLSYRADAATEWVLAVHRTQYGENHSAGKRDVQKTVGGVKVAF